MTSVVTFGNDNSAFQAGTINGPVQNTFHVPSGTARPETPPLPSIVIPFARDSDFVERERILEDLQTRCAAPDSWTALVGLGGVGLASRSLPLNNVDDARFLLNRLAASLASLSKPLREYLLHCDRGSVLVMTRNKEAALKLIEQRDIIEVEPMDEASALALLEKKLAKYLDDYRKSERKRTSLLKYDNRQLRRDWQAKNSIVTTWQISFKHIRQAWPSAAELLSLMSFFDRQGIPEGVLRGCGKQEDNERVKGGTADSDGEDDASESSTSVRSKEDTFEDDVVALRNFCFISDETGRTSFEMHALVQLAMRTWLAANSELKQWQQQFISKLSTAFPTGAYKNWAVCQKLFVHVKMAAAQKLKERSSLLN
ncbi:hypothetical protein SLS59_007087 [Nothophoma quercina]|uniref:Uncharacterized protein n=1 Tax=Nothophoma quercina TaxID=749835 RepID=A0ABR3R289_9PLEO